jgi:hypothetical protein
MKIDFQVDQGSIKDLKATMERAGMLLIKRSKEAVREEVSQIMEESEAQVPVETGTLQASAFIEEDENGNLTFGYGRADAINPKTGENAAEYMMVVHERLDTFHPVGKAKFFEDPLLQHIIKMEQTLAGKIKKAFRGW